MENNQQPQLTDKELKILQKAQRPFWKKKRFIVPVSLILLIIIVANLGGDNSGSTPTGGSVAETNKTEDKPVKKTNKPTISKDEFDQIKSGMSYEEVTKIIGGDGEVLSESGNKGEQYHTVIYQYEGEGGFGANANLTFQGNKLQNKAQFGLE